MQPSAFPNPTETATSGSDFSKNNQNWHPVDQKLRSFGFVIASRPDEGPTVWRKWDPKGREWVHYTEEEALDMISDSVKSVENKGKKTRFPS